MLTEPTLDRLRALRLGAMADAYRTQLQDPAIGALSFDERVGLLVDAEHLSRDNRKLGRRLKEAKLRMAQACLEGLEYAPRRELDRALMRQLATGRWIAEHRNVLITGATGVGKTYLACALGQHACRQGYRGSTGACRASFKSWRSRVPMAPTARCSRGWRASMS